MDTLNEDYQIDNIPRVEHYYLKHLRLIINPDHSDWSPQSIQMYRPTPTTH